MIHRFVTMINDQLGTSLRVPDIDVPAELAKLPPLAEQSFVPDSSQGDVSYDEMELGTKAVYAYMMKGDIGRAVQILTSLLDKYPAGEAWRGRFNDIWLTFQQCERLRQAQPTAVSELLRMALLEAVSRVMSQGIALKEIGVLPALLDNLQQDSAIINHLKQQSGKALILAADYFKKQQQLSQAVGCIEAAAKAGDSLGTEYYLQAAEIYRLAGQAEKAIESYKKAVM